jgi:hypothetical protein
MFFKNSKNRDSCMLDICQMIWTCVSVHVIIHFVSSLVYIHSKFCSRCPQFHQITKFSKISSFCQVLFDCCFSDIFVVVVVVAFLCACGYNHNFRDMLYLFSIFSAHSSYDQMTIITSVSVCLPPSWLLLLSVDSSLIV